MLVTLTHLDGGCLARQVGLSRLVVPPMYLDDGALVVSLASVAVGHIGPPSSPGVAPDPVIFVPGHRSGQSSPVNIVSQCRFFLLFSFSLLITRLMSVCNYVLVNFVTVLWWSIPLSFSEFVLIF